MKMINAVLRSKKSQTGILWNVCENDLLQFDPSPFWSAEYTDGDIWDSTPLAYDKSQSVEEGTDGHQ